MGRTIFWYCSYGSELAKQRMTCYIKGGQPMYGRTANRGCADKRSNYYWKTMTIPYKLSFGLPGRRQTTHMWGDGGVAFISREAGTDTEHTTYARLWKVTNGQLHDLYRQKEDWYNDFVRLGELEGLAIFAFTYKGKDMKILKPSMAYVKTMMVGLKEAYPNLMNAEIVSYLVGLEGIQGSFTAGRLNDLVITLEEE